MKNNNKNEEKTPEVKKGREIKQVFVSEDGKETSVTSKFIKTEEEAIEESVLRETEKVLEDDTQIYNPAVHKKIVRRHHYKSRPFRMAVVAIVLVVSIVFSAGMGATLALWDSKRTFGEFGRMIFPTTVLASTTEAVSRTDVSQSGDNTEASGEKLEADDDNNSTATAEEVKSEETASEEKSEATGVDDEVQYSEDVVQQAEDTTQEKNITDASQAADVASAITNEISGVESFAKAGQEDVITNVGESTKVIQYVDPNANYPLPFTMVDESYFADALFIGDSRMQGFGLWSGIPATFYCATGFQLYKYDTTKVVQTENGKVPIFDAMPFDAFTKVYIKVGLNEIGWNNEETFEQLYAEFIAKVREREPRAVIYIHGLLPVTAEKSATDSYHTNAKIEARNEALKQFAVAQKAYFVDAGEALKGEDGCLPAEMTSDGIHLKSQYMSIWKQYLLEHAVLFGQ